MRLAIKTVTNLIILSMLLPYLTWAFDGVNYVTAQPGVMALAYQGKSLSIPAKFGATIKAHQALGKTVICIQDLHCNYEVQTHIKDIIAYLAKKYQLKLIAQEGAIGRVDTSIISDFPNAKIKAAVSDYFMKQGRLTGADVYAANSKSPVTLVGLEDNRLYQDSLDTVHGFLNAETQGYIYDLRDALDEIKSKVYTGRPLKRLEAKRQAYRQGGLDVYNYFYFLKSMAKRLKINYQQYSALANLAKTQPNRLADSIDRPALDKELDQLDQQLRQAVYTIKAEKQADQLSRRLEIMEKLFNISVTPEELAEFKQNRAEYNLQAFIDFIAKHHADHGYLLDQDVLKLDQQLKKVAYFYQLAEARSIKFVDNLEKWMDETGETLAVMVNGGFHA